MKIKNIQTLIAVGAIALMFTSCKKEECHECHYDINGSQVELGKKCGDDLESLEKNGYAVDGTVYDVHCHEH